MNGGIVKMYGLLALFDESTETAVKGIWKALKDHSISSYAYEVEDRKPHITLASYRELDIAQFIGKMDEFYVNQRKVDISFNAIGSFLQSGTLFLSPTITSELMELHTNHHRYFSEFNDPESMYLPNSWIPHCTLANRLPAEKLQEAFVFSAKEVSSISGSINEVALIEVLGSNEISVIFSKKFN